MCFNERLVAGDRQTQLRERVVAMPVGAELRNDQSGAKAASAGSTTCSNASS